MVKTPIGILDMGIDNISVLNYLSKVFKREHFIYINDLEVPDYEKVPEEQIKERVLKNIEILKSRNVKLIVVVSNTIIEYCRDMFDDIPIPIINIVDMIIDYVNQNYEHRNMALIAIENIMNANIYQKFIKYNHLYNLFSDNIETYLHSNHPKTTESFRLTRDLLRTVLKKDLNIIIPSSFNMMLIETEIEEYLPGVPLLNINEILESKIKAALLAIENFEAKGKGLIEVIINIEKKGINFDNLLKIKYGLTTTYKRQKGKRRNEIKMEEV